MTATGHALTRRSLGSKSAAALRLLAATIESESPVLARLRWMALRTPSRVPGTFRFPFGDVRYLDAWSLVTMYSEIFVDRVYEAELPEAPTILDCGANIGLATIWFKLRHPRARVALFEPDPVNVDALSENLHAVRAESVEVVPAAVTATAGRVPFARETTLTGHVGGDSGMAVESVRLSERIERPVDLLKLDVEGSEFDVIDDLSTSRKIDLVDRIVCEIHGTSSSQERIAALWRALAASGFRWTISELRAWPTGPGPDDPTPFTSVPSGKFLLHLYAWRPR